MPKKLFFEGGLQSTIKGDGPGAIIKRLFSRTARAIDVAGYMIEFRPSRLVAAVTIPEAEWQAGLDKAEAEKRAQESAQAEEKVRAEAARAEALKKGADDFIAKHGPDSATWPEHLRPAPKAN